MKARVVCPHCGQFIDNAMPAVDVAIRYYYRSKAAGARTTLRDVGKMFEYSHDYLRKAKRAYDAAGKWGSKKGGA